MAKITCGVNELENDRFDGKTVAQLRNELGAVLNVPANPTILLNAEPIDDEETVLEDGDELEFVKAAGEKGC